MNKTIKTLFFAIRPQSLVASAAPVIIATSMAFGDGIWHLKTAVICLIAAIILQIITNLVNEYCDYKNGVDQEKFLGQTGFSQADLINNGTMLKAIYLFTLLAIFLCAILIIRGGLPIAIIALLSIPAAIFYTAGKKPLGYRGWGDLMVFLFFGPIASAGTYYVQSFEINSAVIIAGIAPGLISMGVLIVNNIRDMENDKASGKKTLVVKYGKTFGQYEYVFSIIIASLIPSLIFVIIQDHWPIVITSIISLLATPTIISLLTKNDRNSYNNTLASTGQLIAIYTTLFSILWII